MKLSDVVNDHNYKVQIKKLKVMHIIGHNNIKTVRNILYVQNKYHNFGVLKICNASVYFK
jgi:hypothetical protein